MSSSRTLLRRLAGHPRRWISSSARLQADPWPLPFTQQHIENTETPTDIPRPIPIERHNESESTTRARLLYQSRKRGTLENDLLLATFARDNLATMSVEEMQVYDKVRKILQRITFSGLMDGFQLLDEPDWDVYYWATGKRAPPERWANSPLLEKLAVHAKNEGKVVRRMPAL